MHKKKIFLLIGLVCVFFYIGALSYFSHFYNEKRWIPRVVLTLPNLIEHQHDIVSGAPDVFPQKENENVFQVLFDTTPLPALDLIRDWRDETNALQTYAKPFFDENLPKISIVLTEVGLNDDLFADAIQKLPTAVTLSFSPYTLDLTQKIKYARGHGFENMLDLPVESKNGYANAGKYALKSGMSVSDASDLIQNQYFGLNIPFIGFYSNAVIPIPKTDWEQVKNKNITPYGLMSLSSASVDAVYQADFYESAIENALKIAEKEAIEKGKYILVFPMHPKVVDVLVHWIGLQFHPKVSFVPLSLLKGSLND